MNFFLTYNEKFILYDICFSAPNVVYNSRLFNGSTTVVCDTLLLR
jgi:hypothetical protein